MNTLPLTDNIKRITTYYSCCASLNYKSISSIADYSGVPIEVIRNDFYALLSSNNFSILCAYEDLEYYLSKSEVREICKNAKITYSNYDDALEDICDYVDEMENLEELRLLFKRGLLDNIPFKIMDMTSSGLSDNNFLPIPVSIDEYMAYMNLYEQKSLPKKVDKENTLITTTIRNKKYVCEFDNSILGKLENIEAAIKENQNIKFKYSNSMLADKYSDSKEVSIKPMKIVFNATDNSYFVLTTTNKKIMCYNLEHIVGTITVDKTLHHTIRSELLSTIDKVWGTEFDKCTDENGNPTKGTHIKVKFYNEANVISKCKRDLWFRNPLSLETDESGNLIYEDIVYGEESFISWVLSFGSSARIMEPESMVNKIVAKLKDMKLNC